MKILQYSLGLPPYRRGGLPRYSTDLSAELSRYNEVTLLYPGKMTLKARSKLKFVQRKSSQPFNVIEMENPLPVSLGLGINLSEPYMATREKENILLFLKNLKPDIIHIHTLMGLPIEFLEVAKQLKIKTVYTTHDFYGLCPKMLTENPKSLLENRACSFDCMLCKDGPSIKKIRIMQSHLYMNLKNSFVMKKIRQKQKGKIADANLSDNKSNEKISTSELEERYKLRLYYMRMFSMIDEFHFNSTVSQDYVKKYLPNVRGKVINITHKGLKRTITKFSGKKVKIGYIGPYDEKKGFFELTKVLKEIRKEYKNFEFHAYGDIIENEIFTLPWAKNHGVINSNEMDNVYNELDILVMPSLWHETFGFTTLEALTYDDVCLVSQNVGAKDLVNPKFIFSDKKDLETKLIYFLENPLQRIRKEKERIISQNLPIDFVKHVNDIYEGLYVN